MKKITLLFNLLTFFSIITYGQTPPPPPTITGITDLCYGESTTLMASGVPNAGIEWRTAPYPDGYIILPNSTVFTTPSLFTNIFYYVEQRDPATGLWSSATEVLVSIHSVPSITASNDTLIYSGNPLTLSASGADTYTWSPGSLSGQSITVSPDMTTTYTVTGTNLSPASCNDTEDVIVTVLLSPPSVSGDLTFCGASNTQLVAAGATGASFTWYDAPTGGNILSSIDTLTTMISDTSLFYVEQTLGGQTSDRREVEVITFPSPNPLSPAAAEAIADSICWGESTGLIASVDSASGQMVHWYDAATGGNLLGFVASGDTFDVSPTTTTTYYAQSQVPVFNHTFNYTGGLQTFTIPDGITQINIDAYGARGGDTQYTSGGYGLGGRVQTTMDVTPGQILNIYVGGAGGNHLPGIASPPGGYNGGGKANNGGAGGGGATDIRINGTAAADRVIVAGAGGGRGWGICSNSQGGGIPHGGGLTGASGKYCTGGANELERGRGGSQTAGGRRGCKPGGTDCAISGGFGIGGRAGYRDGGGGGSGWYGGGGGISRADGGGGSSYTDPTLCSDVIHTQGYNSGHGMLTISYTFLSVDCASETRVPVTVEVIPLVTVVASADVYNCPGMGVTLTASGANTYTWEPGGLSGASITVDPSTTTTYTVTGSNGFCTNTDEVIVSVSDVVASADVDICEGQTTTLTASGGNNYTWEPGSLSGASVVVSPTDTTLYIVTSIDPSACVTTDSVWVNVNKNPILTASNDTLLTAGYPISLTASGADTYSWSPGGAGQTITLYPSSATTYTVTGTYSATGCTATESVVVSIVNLPSITGATTLLVNDSTTLSASGASGTTFSWHDAETGGNLLSSDTSYTTPALMQNSVIYVGLNDGQNSSPRVPVNITVIDSTLVRAEEADSIICMGSSTHLSAASNSTGLVHWYDSLTGGNLIGSTEEGLGLLVSPSDTQTYYVESTPQETTETFNYTGSVQTFTVPNGITSIEIDAYGARGGRGNPENGLNGGRVQATLNVTPGEVLNIYVGGHGQDYWSPANYNPRLGGYNGGATSNSYNAGGGGGATDIRVNGTSLYDRVLVAGGGGGNGGSSSCMFGKIHAGDGGGLIGENGGTCNTAPAGRTGKGGTQTAGGAAGFRFNVYAEPGSFGYGGGGLSSGGHGGGGGGGGWYGGGGGISSSDGGGGSSYTKPSLFQNIVHTQGARYGHGLLTITYSKTSTNTTRTPVIIMVTPTDVMPPVPDGEIEDQTGEPPFTVPVPSATDQCMGGGFTATTSDPLTYNSSGSYVINWVFSDGNGNFSYYSQTIVIGSGLPVELSDFVAHCEGQKVQLNWRTESEINSSHFEVQHSQDGLRWEKMGNVQSVGNSQIAQDYEFSQDSRFGFDLYRLKQVDFDGMTDYSKIINAHCNTVESKVSIYPNPTDDNFTVTYEGTTETELTIQLIDNTGRLLEEQTLSLSNGRGQIDFSLDQYPSGFYNLQINNAQTSQSYRIIKTQE